MKKIVNYLNENPGMETYVVEVSIDEVPKDLKITSLKQSIENVIGKCEVKMNMIAKTGIMNFKIIRQGV